MCQVQSPGQTKALVEQKQMEISGRVNYKRVLLLCNGQNKAVEWGSLIRLNSVEICTGLQNYSRQSETMGESCDRR